MKRTRFKKYVVRLGVLIPVLSTLFLSSCVYDRQFAYLNDQIVALNRRVTNLQETVDKKVTQDLEARLELIRNNQKEVRVELDQLGKEVKDLAGRTEDNEHVIKRAVERDLGERDTMQTTLADMTRRVADLERVVKLQQGYLGLEQAVGEAKEQAQTPSSEKDQTAPSQEGPAAEPKTEEVTLYDQSLASFREGKFEEAMEGFNDFLKNYPKSDRADNAQFWIGECFMSLKQYEQAILAFQEVIKKYPKGNKVPNALLRQSLAFWEIKDKTSARLLLKKIIKQYPKSNEAKIAQKRLDTLK